MKNKDFYREKAKIKRSEIFNRHEKDCIIRQKVVELVSGRNFKSLFLYVSINGEVDTAGIISALSGKVELYVPYTCGVRMIPVRLNPAKSIYHADKLGNIYTHEEAQDYAAEQNFNPDITLIPMLAFNKQFYRLGYGGGYYDKFLSVTETLKVGLAYDEQQDDEFPHDNFDERLDVIVTPTRTLRR